MAAAGVPAGAAALAAPAHGVDALLTTFDEVRWNHGSPLGTPATVTYSFLQFVPGYYPEGSHERFGFARFTAEQMEGARRALALISEVANITFVETAGVGDITFGTAIFAPEIQAYTYFPVRSDPGWQQQGDVWLNNYWADNNDQTAGTFGFMTMLHEIGHAVGLKHSFDSELGPVLPLSLENRRYTVMS